MKNLLFLLLISLLSCNDTNKKEEIHDSIVVDIPVLPSDTISENKASDSLKEARIKAKDSIKVSLGK
jgi:hypothetical protein